MSRLTEEYSAIRGDRELKKYQQVRMGTRQLG